MALFRTGLYVKDHSVEKVQVASTPIASFNGNVTGLYIPEIIAEIAAKQSGSGTPAPDNIRPIIGVSGCNVVDMSDITNIDYFQGLLNGTYGFIDLGTLNWSYQGANHFFYVDITGIKRPASNNVVPNCICPIYTTVARNNFDDDMEFSVNATTDGVRIYNESYTDAAAFKTAMSEVYLIYELATATTPTITAEQFNTLLNAFSIDGLCVNIALGDTYYGCLLNVTTGLLTIIDKGKFLKDLSWSNNSSYSDVFNGTGFTDRKQAINGGSTSLSTHFAWKTSSNLRDTDNTIALGIAQSGSVENRTVVYVHPDSTIATTKEEFETWCETSNAMIVCPLATPITVQLTPTQVEQLLVNNVFADTGDVEVKFYNVVR